MTRAMRSAGAAQRAWERGKYVRRKGWPGKIEAVIYRGRTRSLLEFLAYLSA